MIQFLKFLKGYLCIRVWGFSPERFMNLCSMRDILLWDIVKDNEEYRMCISLKSFYRLKAITRKTGTRVVILERYGLPFLLPGLRKRKFFMIGLFCALFFWIGSSFFVWDIEVEGNYQVTTDLFERFLEQQHVRDFMRKDKLDIENLEKEIRKSFPQIIWTSAKLNGNKLCIMVKENDTIVDKSHTQSKEPADLVADYDGEIISIVVRNGVPQVKRGDIVAKGDVLVSGSVPIFAEDGTIKKYHYVCSDADILLEYTKEHNICIPTDYIEREYTGREKKRIFVRVGKQVLEQPISQSFLLYDNVIRQSTPELFDKLGIPISFGTEIYREYLNVEHQYTEKRAKEILEEKFTSFLFTLEEKGVQIIEKDVKIEMIGKTWDLDATMILREYIGKAVEVIEEIHE